MAVSAQVPSVITLATNVDPVAGWSTNGTLIEAINLGPPMTAASLAGGTNVQPCTVNGISFGTNAILTVIQPRSFTGTNEYYYDNLNLYGSSWSSGSDYNAQQLYWTWQVNMAAQNSGADYSLVMMITNPVPNHVYQFQALFDFGWPYSGTLVVGSANGGASYPYTYFDLTSDPNGDTYHQTSASFTWTAQYSTNFGLLAFQQGSFETIVFGYQLRDLSVGKPGIYQDLVISPRTRCTRETPRHSMLPVTGNWT